LISMLKKNQTIVNLLEKYREMSLLGKINAILQWDMNVNLPPKAAEGRVQQSAYLTELITQKWLDSEFRKLVEAEESYGPETVTKEETAMIRNIRHAGKFYWNVPMKLIIDFSEVTSRAFMVWQKAKAENRYADFLPHLRKVITLSREIAEKLGYKDNPYDALLDLYEPGFTTADCRTIFGTIQPELSKIIKKIKDSRDYKTESPLTDGKNKYPIETQKEFADLVIRKMNYDLEAGRMDISSHPFTETLGHFDIRITNRYKESDFRESLMGAMHETGHALYEQGVAEGYDGTPLDGGVSLGIHESQSRFWENQIGRSFDFSKFITPHLKKYYPTGLKNIADTDIYRLMNLVKPSFIRTEADEVTYNLHIALRFEIEESLINGRSNAKDLPEIWRQKMKEYIGVVPKTDREGILQDVHWSNGMFGYFPTYTLGNLYAAQFTKRMRSEIELEKNVEKGELKPILIWLRKNIHQYGSLYWPKELVKKVTGEELNPKYFLEYIKSKYSKIYSLK
jgi:carboxypeptidase Taq